MKPYYSDNRGRYATGESYDWFYKFEDEEDYQIFTSLDGLWTYDIVEDGIELLRYNGNEIHIHVPEMVDNKKVVSLDSTFDGFYELKSAVIPEGVVSIIGAFYGCEGLEEVTLPEGVKDLTYAFNSCFSLKYIKIPNSVEDFSQAFGGTAIEHFEFPQGTKIIDSCFSGSEYLRSVVIPKTVISCDEAFADCEVLERVELEDGICELSDYAFFHCPALKELKIPESVKKLGKMAVGIMEDREYDKTHMAFKIKGHNIVSFFQIIGAQGSQAEQYAKINKISFVNESKEIKLY